MKKACVICAIAAGASLALSADTYLDMPVSAPTNKVYLSSMPTRPWWNKAWAKRAPFLVSSTADVQMPNAMVDVVVDFGEEVKPDEVRVVTPWETEVPCVCEPISGTNTLARLLFRTDLRIRENKPFLVYWSRATGQTDGNFRSPVFSQMALAEDAGTIRVGNGVLDVTFDRYARGGFIRTLHVNGSAAKSELLTRSTGFAWCGLDLSVGKSKWESPARVVCDNAFKKQIVFANDSATMTFTMYADAPRVDFVYVLKPGIWPHLTLCLSTAPGDGCGFDDIYYPGSQGMVLSTPAGLEHATDCLPYPEYDFTGVFSEGWFAVCDRQSRDVVGLVFDRASLGSCRFNGNAQAYGQSWTLGFGHAYVKDPKQESVGGSGALVAQIGTYEDVRNQYLRLATKPQAFLGATESVQDVPVKVTRLDRDYCASYDVSGWKNAEALPGTEWAENLADHVRSLGASVVRLGSGSFEDLPISSNLWARLKAAKRCKDENYKFPDWAEGKYTGDYYKTASGAAHAKGLGVNIWAAFMRGRWWADWQRYPDNNMNFQDIDMELVGLDYELQALYPKCGVDTVTNARLQRENAWFPVRYWIQNNTGDYLKWKDPKEYFRIQALNTEEGRKFYLDAKKRNPDIPVVLWNAENGEPKREMFMAEMAGYFDTCMVEMLPQAGFDHVKHCAKRMRSLFDNEAGRTVHHHYYYYSNDYWNRILEIEQPFICGVNGFSHENITYENYGYENTQIVADFHRFAEYTRLGEKAAKMAPVKSLAVFRDTDAYVDDMLNKRIGYPFAYKALQDNRVHAFGKIRNYNYDVVCNRYFTRGALEKYKVVYVPEDPVFSDALANELLAYVKNGGGAIVEGVTGAKMKVDGGQLKENVVCDYGKGKILWLGRPAFGEKAAKTPTDLLVRAAQGAAYVTNAVASVGGQNPYEIVGSKTLDSVMQSSDEGFLLGVFNDGPKHDAGRVVLGVALRTPVYVLDVKNGVRFVYTNGFDIAVDARRTAYYLIGDDAFTAIPATKPCAWEGACCLDRKQVAPRAYKRPELPTNFTQAVAIEFTSGPSASPKPISLSKDAKIDVTCFNAATYSKLACEKPLEKASYVHLMGNPADFDILFAECAEPLKAMLKRGGAILVDRTATGPAAKKFFASIGVFDPTDSLKKVGDGHANWNSDLPTNHVLRTLSHEHNYFGSQYDQAFSKWDAKNQIVPFVPTLDAKCAAFVAQENVLGAGKVVFSQNPRAFNDWYEDRHYGDSLISWLIGRRVEEHAKLVMKLNGGPGNVVN